MEPVIETARKLNSFWEPVQAVIAASTVGTALFVSSKLTLLVIAPDVTEKQASIASMAFMLLNTLASLVVGFYFGRANHVNHQKTNGHTTQFDRR